MINLIIFSQFKQLKIASTFGQRLMGLMGKRTLADDEGMYFPRCRAVHTFFMRMPIKVIFFDVHGNVIKVIPNLRPWSWAYCFYADSVLECSVNSAI